MNRLKTWLNSRTGRLVTHDAATSIGAAVVAFEASGQQVTWAAATFVGGLAFRNFMRLLLPIPAAKPSVSRLHKAMAADGAIRVAASTVNRARDEHGEYTVTRRHIPETPVAGKPLGRHVHHDSRSLNYLVKADGTVDGAHWPRAIPILNQGDVGACTGNAATGCVGTDPNYEPLEARPSGIVLTETTALAIYSAAEVLDGDGPYPPNDNGSSGLSVAKVCKSEGLISGYLHITSLAAAKTAIQTAPFIVGSDWYTGMDTPDATGLVTATGTVRGGHEYECFAYDATKDLWWFDNSWGTSYGVEGTFCYSSATFTKLLAAQGDATVFLPLATPAPTPTPVPQTDSVVIVDAAVVAHINELAAKGKTTPQAYVTARLRSLWKVS